MVASERVRGLVADGLDFHRHTRHSGLDIAFVAGEVDKRDDLRAGGNNPCPIILTTPTPNKMSRCIEPKDLKCDAGCPSRFYFMSMAKNLASGSPTSIVEDEAR